MGEFISAFVLGVIGIIAIIAVALLVVVTFKAIF